MLRPLLPLALLALPAAAQTPDWTSHAPSTSPSARAGLQGASDGAKLYLFGGNEGPTTYNSDVWSYDGTSWTLEEPGGTGPSGRMNMGLTWDAARNVLVLFGGREVASGAMGDTWEWHPTTGWAQVALTGPTPGPRRWAQLEYLPGVGCVLHGGKDDPGSGTVYDDTWAWDGATWTQLADVPYARQRGRMVRRGAPHDDLVWYGGRDAANVVLNETWRFDGAAWSQVATTTQPGGATGLFAQGMYYDAVRDLVVCFGGTQGAGEKNWTFEFDGADWTEVFPATAPGARTAPALAWVAATSEAYLFGGFSGGFHGDTWSRDAGSVAGSFVVSGAGCPGSTGLTAGLAAAAPPQVGQTFTVDLTNTTPVALPIAAVGLSDTTWLLGSLPFSFSLLFPATPAGCDLLVNPELQLGMALAPGTATLTLPIPNNPGLAGTTIFVQGLQVELLLPAGDLSIATSPKGTAVIGS